MGFNIQRVAIALLTLWMNVDVVDAQCAGDPFMPCFDRATFIELGRIAMDLTSYLINPTDARNSTEFRNRTRAFSENMCKTASATIKCLGSRNFSYCESRAKNNQDAAIAMRFFQSFRYIYWGCLVWFNGASELDRLCSEPVDSLYDRCSTIAADTPLIKYPYEFFSYRSAAPGVDNNITTLTPIAAANCAAFKTRTGCLAAQFMNCSTKSSAVPLAIAKHQLYIGSTNEADCSFSAADTAASLAQLYNSRTTQGDAFWWLSASTSPSNLTSSDRPPITAATASSNVTISHRSASNSSAVISTPPKLRRSTTVTTEKRLKKRTTTVSDASDYDSSANGIEIRLLAMLFLALATSLAITS